MTNSPLVKNSQTISRSVTAVEIARTKKTAHSSLSFLMEVLTSLVADHIRICAAKAEGARTRDPSQSCA
jgi:hypothetical protein